MKLILPPDSSTAHCTLSSDAICWRRASPRDLLSSHPLFPEVFLDHLPVLDENQRLWLEQRTKAAQAKP